MLVFIAKCLTTDEHRSSWYRVGVGELENFEPMATLNPKSLLRLCFPTCHRILIERAIREHGTRSARTLVVGAGADPYRELFNADELYIRLDIDNQFQSVDVLGDGAMLPFGPGTFDRVVAIEVMEHIEDQRSFVNELHRILVKDGTVVLSVPFMYHIHGDPYDYWRPTYWGLRRLFDSFDIVKISSVGNRFHVLCDLVLTAHVVRYLFFPFRAFNHIFCLVPGKRNPLKNHAPSAYFLVASK